jgi:hypothetical protein
VFGSTEKRFTEAAEESAVPGPAQYDLTNAPGKREASKNKVTTIFASSSRREPPSKKEPIHPPPPGTYETYQPLGTDKPMNGAGNPLMAGLGTSKR